METTKKAPDLFQQTDAHAENISRLSKQGNSCTAIISQPDPSFNRLLFESIPLGGESDAVDTKTLAKWLGWHVRNVTMGIHNLRVAGVFICSSGKGYWRSVRTDDIRHFVNQMRSRQREIGAALAPAEIYLAEQEHP